MNNPQAWGFFSPQAELRLQSIMGLQTWNSIRSLDFLCSLPDVDRSRIGVTGASGGGTQTFILCAVDPRPTAAFAAVMVSTGMQGGCTCENCCQLRVDSGNVEFAALFAPKPLGLTAADDWTREMPTRGFPELRSVYKLSTGLAAGDGSGIPLSLMTRLEFGHNYNQVSREAMYRFMNRYLELGLADDPLREQPVEVLPPGRLTVYNETHPRPAWNNEQESRLLKDWDRLGRISALDSRPLFDDSFLTLQATVGTALNSLILHPDLETAVHWDETASTTTDDHEIRYGDLRTTSGELSFRVALADRSALRHGNVDRVSVILDESGVAGFSDMTGPVPESAAPRADQISTSVVGVRMNWLPGMEYAAGQQGNRLVDNGRAAAGYTYGYNRTLLAWRVSQLLYLIETLREQFPNAPISVDADRSSTPVAILARAISRQDIELHCQLDGFRFANITDIRDPDFLPGAVKFGDVDAFLAARPGARLEIRGETSESLPLTTSAFHLKNAMQALTFDAR